VSLTRRELLEAFGVMVVMPSERAAVAPQAAAASVSFTSLRRDVGIFTGRGGTIGWLITPDAVVVVDSQFPDTAGPCLEGVKSRATRPIDFLINTHHHPDHTSGNIVFQPAVKHIAAHRKVPALQKRSAEQQSALESQAYADTLYDTEWSQELGRETLKLRYFGPAHTSGDSVVTFAHANVAHVGDLVFRQRHPVVDRSAGGTIKNWIAVLDAIGRAHDGDTIYVFGHAKEGAGTSGTAADLRAMRDYLNAVLEMVQKSIASGKSRDEIIAIAALPHFEEYHAVPPRGTLANVLGAAYDELTAK
jgi:glyoxylase-like metal-dependent hydrolase (beta-lactamase superfamily II)